MRPKKVARAYRYVLNVSKIAKPLTAEAPTTKAIPGPTENLVARAALRRLAKFSLLPLPFPGQSVPPSKQCHPGGPHV
jgi:hypothetical protein